MRDFAVDSIARFVYIINMTLTQRIGNGLNKSWLVPPRRKNESPIQYYRRTGCVDNRYQHRHNGRYYCNPAHCSGTWKDKKKRDEHLDMAYAILD